MIVFLMALFLVLTSNARCACVPQSPNVYVQRQTGAAVQEARLISKRDTHGGFFGDGCCIIILDCKELDDIEASLKGWKELPSSEELHSILYGEDNYGAENRGGLLRGDDDVTPAWPDVENGLYYFKNRNSEARSGDDEDMQAQHSFNFTYAVYDRENRMLYYYEVDT